MLQLILDKRSCAGAGAAAASGSRGVSQHTVRGLRVATPEAYRHRHQPGSVGAGAEGGGAEPRKVG